MAERKSFVIYRDWEAWLDMLSNEQKGAWVSALFDYQSQGQPYDGDDPMVKLAFAFARTTLDRDNEKYQARCAANARNGQKGGRPRKSDEAAGPLPEPEEAAAPPEGNDAPFEEPEGPDALAERWTGPEEVPENPPTGVYRPSPHPAAGAGYPPAWANGTLSPDAAGRAERSFEQARRRVIQQLQRNRFESCAPPRAGPANAAEWDRSRFY